jgi:hypothetical protein
MANKQGGEFDAWRATKNSLRAAFRSKTVTATPRLIATGALIGTATLAILTMLGLPHLDRPLTFSLYCFAVALPMLVLGYPFGTQKYENKRSLLFVRFLSEAAWVLETGVGYILMALGFLAILAHFSISLAITAVVSAVAWYVLSLIGASGAAIIYIWRHRRGFERLNARRLQVRPPNPPTPRTSAVEHLVCLVSPAALEQWPA